MVAIRVLHESDASSYNAFFAAGAARHSSTLRISPEDVSAAPFDTRVVGDGRTLGAFDEAGKWLGVVTVERERGRTKRRHIAWILRMYVAETASGRGVGRALLGRALEEAEHFDGVTKVNLTVAAQNERAVKLYTQAGFVEFAREEDAFRDPAPRAELTMSRPISAAK